MQSLNTDTITTELITTNRITRYFRIGRIATHTLAGVIIAFISGSEGGEKLLSTISAEEGLVHALSQGGYFMLGTAMFAAMGMILYKVALKK